MIEALIFDFGQVLVRFDPSSMVARYVQDSADAALLTEVVFDRLYWDALDAGTITDEDALKAVCERLPSRLHETARTIHYHWIHMLPEIDGMDALLSELKDAGVPLYLLSNISRYFADNSHCAPILRHFDGCVYSAVCGYCKPHRAIFEHICRTYGLVPSTTLFIDDNEKNIEGAKAFGLQGFLFDGHAASLREYLREAGVL